MGGWILGDGNPGPGRREAMVADLASVSFERGRMVDGAEATTSESGSGGAALGLVDPQAAVILPPPVEGLLRDSHLPDQVSHRHPQFRLL